MSVRNFGVQNTFRSCDMIDPVKFLGFPTASRTTEFECKIRTREGEVLIIKEKGLRLNSSFVRIDHLENGRQKPSVPCFHVRNARISLALGLSLSTFTFCGWLVVLGKYFYLGGSMQGIITRSPKSYTDIVHIVPHQRLPSDHSTMALFTSPI